jgi:CheY-like chemotaxis protein
MNILIVEDGAVDRKLAGVVLKTADHRVSEHGSAEDALQSMTTDKPDLILLDLRLPGMDGLALVRQLKSNPDTHDIPIVAITAYPDSFKQAELLAAGCAAFLSKPINTRTLSQTIIAAAEGILPTE